MPGAASVICVSVVDSDTRRFSLISGRGSPGRPPGQEEGLADVLILQRRGVHPSSREAEQALYQNTLAEYCWARDVAALAPTTLSRLVQPVIDVCTFYDVLPPAPLSTLVRVAGRRWTVEETFQSGRA